MQTTDKVPYVIILVLALLTLAGFFYMFDKIGTLGNKITNLELAAQLAEQQKNPPATVPVAAPSPAPAPALSSTPAPQQHTVQIPTAIIFKASSSPLLAPRTQLSVTVEFASRTEDGTLTLAVKVFTSETSSYSALDVKSLFELVDLTGNNQTPTAATGSFNSMPPHSAVTGTVQFQMLPNIKTAIIQVQTNGDMKFYEFDFSKQTYRETVIG